MKVYKEGEKIQKGIGIGNILVLEEFVEPKKETGKAEEQLTVFDNAINKAKANIEFDIKNNAEKLGSTIEIIEAHLQMIQDPEYKDQIVSKIKELSYTAEYSVFEVSNEFAAVFESMDSDYFRERAQDIKSIGISIIDIIRDKKSVDISHIEEDTIIVAEELLPSQAVLLNKRFIKGIAVVKAGKTSHTAIVAKTLAIPMLSRIPSEFIDEKYSGKKGIVDVDSNTLILNADRETLKKYTVLKEKEEEKKKFYNKFRGKESLTKDGKKINISSNISLPNNVEQVIENDSDGIGLFRSEFLYMDRNSAPTIKEQVESYSKVLKKMGDKPVIIRTMDIGGDKQIDYINIPAEENPFLGFRAIRYCLKEKNMLKNQFSALLEASVHGNLHIMIPMISTVNEILEVKAIFEEVKEELRELNIPFKKDIPFGIMIEVPSACIMSDELAKEVDFFSIGTNDLIQYTLACDRMNESVSYLYNYDDEAVLRLVKMTIENGHKNGIWVGMCGDMANQENLVPILIEMGIDELSVTPSNVLPTRYIVSITNSNK
ncbi:MAG: phosphoenolpyruvate--protein phosphotransferase [Clostridiales bacterium]|nr:MAG: phosphoenolpyruvate--protein phosphotransferase [Clostridiales bacterium]